MCVIFLSGFTARWECLLPSQDFAFQKFVLQPNERAENDGEKRQKGSRKIPIGCDRHDDIIAMIDCKAEHGYNARIKSGQICMLLHPLLVIAKGDFA